MVTEYHSERGIEAAGEHYVMWRSATHFAMWAAGGIATLLLVLFFTVV